MHDTPTYSSSINSSIWSIAVVLTSAAGEGGTSTAGAPQGQQQQQRQQEQPPASQQMFQVCSEYRVHIFRAASTESNGVILEAVMQ